MARQAISTETKNRLLADSEGACSVCGRTLVPLQVAHITPISQGGTDTYENLTVVCLSCHQLLDSGMDFETAREMASSAYRLELVTARTLHMAGFSVIRGVTDRDAGVDIVARRARANSDELETILIECKGGTRTLASRAIEAFSEKSAQFAADLCVIVTATGWTLDAQNTAERLSVVLVPVEEIGEFVKRLVQERYL